MFFFSRTVAAAAASATVTTTNCASGSDARTVTLVLTTTPKISTTVIITPNNHQLLQFPATINTVVPLIKNTPFAIPLTIFTINIATVYGNADVSLIDIQTTSRPKPPVYIFTQL